MGFERAAIYGIIELNLDSTAAGELDLFTDLPGNVMTVREVKTIPTTHGRRVVRFRLKGTTKGRLYSVKVTVIPGGVIRLYGGRIWARELPGTEWNWYAIPIPETSGEWMPVKLAIPEMGDWSASKLAIPEMGEWTASKLAIPEMGDWSASKLAIPPTSEEWTPVRLPIKPTPDNPEWVSLEIDQ